MGAVLDIICFLLMIYWIVLFARILLSWFPRPSPGSVARSTASSSI